MRVWSGTEGGGGADMMHAYSLHVDLEVIIALDTRKKGTNYVQQTTPM